MHGNSTFRHHPFFGFVLYFSYLSLLCRNCLCLLIRLINTRACPTFAVMRFTFFLITAFFYLWPICVSLNYIEYDGSATLIYI